MIPYNFHSSGVLGRAPDGFGRDSIYQEAQDCNGLKFAAYPDTLWNREPGAESRSRVLRAWGRTARGFRLLSQKQMQETPELFEARGEENQPSEIADRCARDPYAPGGA